MLGLKNTLTTRRGTSGEESLLLDDYPATAAFSLRYLSSSYTGPVITCARTADAATQTFTPTQISDGTLLTFASGGDAWITIFHDVTGNSNNGTQVLNRAYVVQSGVLVTDGGLPAINFVNGSFDLSGLHNQAVLDVYTVLQTTDTAWAMLSETFNGSNISYIATSGSTNTTTNPGFGTPQLYVNNVLTSPSNRGDVYTLLSTGNNILKIIQGGSTIGWSDVTLFRYNGLTYTGLLKEIIFYTSNQSSNKTAISNNINSYYTIY